LGRKKQKGATKMKGLLKKASILFAIIMILCQLVLTGCSGGSSTLKLAHFWPATHPIETDLIQPWIAAVEEATDGRVKVTSYPAETLALSDAIYEGVKRESPTLDYHVSHIRGDNSPFWRYLNCRV